MIAELPYCVRKGRPNHHLTKTVADGRVCRSIAYGPYGRICLALIVVRHQVNNAMECSAWHNVDKETDDLVHGVEDERVAPHDDGNGVVPESEAVGTNKQALRLWEDPEAENEESVHEVTQVGKEVVVTFLVVGVVSEWHEVKQLDGVPQREPFGTATHQISGDEDVHDGGYERGLFACSDGGVRGPLLVETLDGLAHTLLVLFQLLAFVGNTAPPLLYRTVLGARGPSLCSLPESFGLCRDGLLEFLDALGQSQVLNEVKHGQAFDRREEGGLFGVGVVHVGGAVGEGV